jgi:hypothetical protein
MFAKPHLLGPAVANRFSTGKSRKTSDKAESQSRRYQDERAAKVSCRNDDVRGKSFIGGFSSSANPTVLGRFLAFSVLVWCTRQGGYGLFGNVSRATSTCWTAPSWKNEKDGKGGTLVSSSLETSNHSHWYGKRAWIFPDSLVV